MKTYTAVLAAVAYFFSPLAIEAQTAPSRQGLVLEYLFDGNSGDRVRDTSGNRLHGFVQGTGVDHFGPGHSGTGLVLNGVNNFVLVNDNPLLDLNRYTLMAWVKYQADNQLRQEIMEKVASYWLNIRMPSRAVRAGGFFGGCAGPNVWVFLDSTRPVPEDTWTHVASTYNGATLKIFINGRLAGQRAVSGSVCMNTNPLGVGAKHAPAERRTEAFFNGVMDDVRVYNRALSGTQIRALINLP